ncbi:uncharacterized protein RHOBADRAFT_51457, partial [Rhodotorula graminis WP1]
LSSFPPPRLRHHPLSKRARHVLACSSHLHVPLDPSPRRRRGRPLELVPRVRVREEAQGGKGPPWCQARPDGRVRGRRHRHGGGRPVVDLVRHPPPVHRVPPAQARDAQDDPGQGGPVRHGRVPPPRGPHPGHRHHGDALGRHHGTGHPGLHHPDARRVDRRGPAVPQADPDHFVLDRRLDRLAVDHHHGHPRLDRGAQDAQVRRRPVGHARDGAPPPPPRRRAPRRGHVGARALARRERLGRAQQHDDGREGPHAARRPRPPVVARL